MSAAFALPLLDPSDAPSVAPRRPPLRLVTPGEVPVRPAGGSLRPGRATVLPVPRDAGRTRVGELRPPVVDLPVTRLTRRGVVLLSAVVAALCGSVVWLAAASATGPTTAGTATSAHLPSVVTVSTGDTLWSIGSRVAPDTDPRAEVAVLVRLNHLHGDTLTVGQRLRVR